MHARPPAQIQKRYVERHRERPRTPLTYPRRARLFATRVTSRMVTVAIFRRPDSLTMLLSTSCTNGNRETHYVDEGPSRAVVGGSRRCWRPPGCRRAQLP